MIAASQVLSTGQDPLSNSHSNQKVTRAERLERLLSLNSVKESDQSFGIKHEEKL